MAILFERKPFQRDDVTPEALILQLTDDFAAYNSINAFLCRSFTAVMSRHEPISDEAIMGAQRCAEMLQTRAQELKNDLEYLRERMLSKQDDQEVSS